MITATRDGKTREFTDKQWANMGSDYCGWEQVIPVPKEVRHMGVLVEKEPLPIAQEQTPPPKAGKRPKK